MIGLAGAHRTGKTTLARQYAEQTGIPFVETKTSQVFKELGFDPKEDYDFKIRMFIQNRILEVADKLYQKAGRTFITDRTPIDMLAYTMADVQRENLDKDDLAMFEDYMGRCIETTNRHFALLIVVQPGIPLVEEEGKAPLNKAYIEHINSLVLGLTADERIGSSRFFIGRKTLDLVERCGAINSALNMVGSRHLQLVANGIMFQ